MEVNMNIENINRLIAYIPTRRIHSCYGGDKPSISRWMDTSQCFEGIVRDLFGDSGSYDIRAIEAHLETDSAQTHALYGMKSWNGLEYRNSRWSSFTERSRHDQDQILVHVLTCLRDTGLVIWNGVEPQ
jgi:hypothetical protein